jgi:hypothetical protein
MNSSGLCLPVITTHAQQKNGLSIIKVGCSMHTYPSSGHKTQVTAIFPEVTAGWTRCQDLRWWKGVCCIMRPRHCKIFGLSYHLRAVSQQPNSRLPSSQPMIQPAPASATMPMTWRLQHDQILELCCCLWQCTGRTCTSMTAMTKSHTVSNGEHFVQPAAQMHWQGQ